MSFENDEGRERNKQYYLPIVEVKDYNVMIDGRNFFDHPTKSDLKTYDTIRKITIGQGDDYTTRCLLDYPYFKKYYRLIAIDFSKQQKLDVDPKGIQLINVTGNLENVLDFSKGTTQLLWFLFDIKLI